MYVYTYAYSMIRTCMHITCISLAWRPPFLRVIAPYLAWNPHYNCITCMIVACVLVVECLGIEDATKDATT